MQNGLIYFLLLALLQTILLLITSYEYQGAKGKAFSTRKENLTIAGNIILVSIPMTILLGLAEEFETKIKTLLNILPENGSIFFTSLLGIPIVFILIWIVYYKRDSNLLQSSEMDKSFITKFYKDKIITIMKQSKEKYFSFNVIYMKLIIHEELMNDIWSACFPKSLLPFGISREDFTEIFKPFILSKKKLKSILDSLQFDDKRIDTSNNEYFIVP